MDCKRSHLTALAAFVFFFFLYINLRALHGQPDADDYNDLPSHSGYDDNESAYEAGDFDGNGPANSTLGVGSLQCFLALVATPSCYMLSLVIRVSNCAMALFVIDCFARHGEYCCCCQNPVSAFRHSISC